MPEPETAKASPPAPVGPLIRLRAARPTDRAYLANVLPFVTASGPHETPDGFLEAVDDGTLTPIIFQGEEGIRGMALVCFMGAGGAGKALYLAALYGAPDATDGERNATMQGLVRIARHNGCARLTFNSTRSGWARRMERYGFRRSPYITYERSV